jgi:hypothetical protein
MKKAAILAGIVLLVLALGQCDLFMTEIKYLVTSGDTETFEIMFQSDGDITEVTSNTFWEYTDDLYTTDEPRLAFIRVSKSTGASFTVAIQEDGTTVATDTKTPPATIDLYYMIE